MPATTFGRSGWPTAVPKRRFCRGARGRTGRFCSPVAVAAGRCPPPRSGRVHRVLSKPLIDAVRDGVLARDPAASVPLPRVVKPELLVWNREQLVAFLPVAAQDPPVLRLAPVAAGRTPAWRAGRPAVVGRGPDWLDRSNGLTADDRCALASRHQRLLGASRRNRRPRPGARRSARSVPPGGSGRAFAPWACRSPGPPGLFAARRQLATTGTVCASCSKQAARRANVPVIRLHDARRSCATPGARRRPAPLVQQLLGHSSWNITMDPYSHRVHRLQPHASRDLRHLVVPRAGAEPAVT